MPAIAAMAAGRSAGLAADPGDGALWLRAVDSNAIMPGRLEPILADLGAIEALSLPLEERDRLIEERIDLLLQGGAAPEIGSAGPPRVAKLEELVRSFRAVASSGHDTFAKAAEIIASRLRSARE
jgi:hypothetical protein